MDKYFSKEHRSSFSYWFAHFCAFNMTALTIGKWKFKYLFHDWEKPWLMLLWKGNYKKVQKWHREHSRHHIEYFKKHGVAKTDWEAIAIDWECSGLTKKDSPRNAADAIREFRPRLTTEYGLSEEEANTFVITFKFTLERLGLDTPTTYFSNNKAYSHIMNQLLGNIRFVAKTNTPLKTFLSTIGYTMFIEADHRHNIVYVSKDGKSFLMEGIDGKHCVLMYPDEGSLEYDKIILSNIGYEFEDVTEEFYKIIKGS